MCVAVSFHEGDGVVRRLEAKRTRHEIGFAIGVEIADDDDGRRKLICDRRRQRRAERAAVPQADQPVRRFR
jgi:hypothetical protein